MKVLRKQIRASRKRALALRKLVKIYISGPISGLEYNDAFFRFAYADGCIRYLGHTPVNPMFNGLTSCAPWADHMMRDLELLRECDAIVMLDGWDNSVGCKIEKLFAEKLGLKVFMGLDELQRASHDAERK